MTVFEAAGYNQRHEFWLTLRLLITMTTFRFILLAFLSIIFGNKDAHAQDSTTFNWDAQLLQSVSFTGISTSPVVGLRYKDFQLHVGPRFVWFNAYTIQETPMGLALGLSYYPNGNTSKFPAFVVADYQSVYVPQYCPNGQCDNDRRRTDELSLGYGFRIPVAKRLDLSTSIHIGFYQEIYTTVDELEEVVGYTGMFRVGFHYRFYDL